MVLEIILYHLIRYLTRCGAKITSCPEMTSPISFFDHWEFLEEFARRPAFDSTHYFTRCHGWWCRYKDMNMVLTHNTALDCNFKSFTRLSNEFSNSQCLSENNLNYNRKIRFKSCRRLAKDGSALTERLSLSFTSPSFASCCVDLVILHNVFGQTLNATSPVKT